MSLIATVKKPVALGLAFLLMVMAVAPVAAVIEADEAFYNTWARTDKPVADGLVQRTWMWGPEANSEVIAEPYVEHPTGERPVQYWDKSRMEVNDPNAPYDGQWYVTNGLLVVELMTGMLQVGDDEFEEREPAMVNIAGDAGFAETPTYAAYATLMDDAAWDDGATITATVDAGGNVGSNDDLTEFGVTAARMSDETGHRTASVFWEFMTSEGIIWDWETGATMTGPLFQNPYYATGYPITEAYWANIMVDGTEQWVLTQAFERRVLTYTPGNEPGWQVEAGNVGLHYWEWRYETDPPGQDPVEVDDQAFYAELTVAAEVPQPTMIAEGSDPSGDAVVFVNEDGNLEFAVYVVDIVDVTAAHIHVAPVGEPGPVVVPLFMGDFSTEDDGTGTLATGVITDADLAGPLEGMTLGHLLAEMEAGNTYVNVHTALNGPGEIRGQLALLGDDEPAPMPPAPEPPVEDGAYVATLTGGEEVPAVETAADGDAVVFVNADGDLGFEVYVTNIQNVNAAHIHLGAVGANGGVVALLFDGAFSTDGDDVATLATGVITADDLSGDLEGMTIADLVAEIEAGGAYVNVHTEANPGGEIRGQLHVGDGEHMH